MPDKRVTELTQIDAVTGIDLLLVVDDPSGTATSKKATVDQMLVNVAKTDVSNTFTGDQTVDGDLFVTGEVNPALFLAQLPKINLLSGVAPGDPSGSRTVMSQSLVSGLSIRHDEALSQGRVAVGNYDEQLYQPLLFEVESFQVHTGVSPGDRVERLRVHPLGGVTVGADHTVDPGVGNVNASGNITAGGDIYANGGSVNADMVLAGVLVSTPSVMATSDVSAPLGQFDSLGTTPLDATKLTGAVPAASLPANVAKTDAANTFTADQTLNKAKPRLTFLDTGQPADKRVFIIEGENQWLTFRTLTDAGATEQIPFTLYRTGACATGAGLTVETDLSVNGNSFLGGNVTAFSNIAVTGNVTAANLKWRQGHTWGLVGDVSAQTILPYMYVALVGTQTCKMVGLRMRILTGTSITVTLTRGGVAETGGIVVTPTATTTVLNIALANDDQIGLTLSAPVGTPTTLSATLFLEHSL